MKIEEMRDQIEGAAEMFRDWEREYDISLSPSIHFTGGEPFLYDGLWAAISHAGECGFKIAILTNGCLVDREIAEKAAFFHVKT